MRAVLISLATTLAITSTAVGQEMFSPIEAPTKLPTRSGMRVTNGRAVPFVAGMREVNRTQGTPTSLAAIAALRARQTPVKTDNLYRAFAQEKLLVVYDYWSDYRFLGELYARQMKDMLSHFGWAVDMVPVQNYQAGMIGSHRATIYMGVFYDTDLPSAFKADVMNATKPVCWTGYNLWKLAWTPSFGFDRTFETKFGFRFRGITDGYKTVSYKNQVLFRQDETANRTVVLDPAKTTVVSRMANMDGTNPPYILKSGNLWVVNDNPLSSVQYSYVDGHDRVLAFADVLHDIVGSGVTTNTQRAVLRIEDVSSSASPTLLRQIADILAAEQVPFVVSTIPFYRDPLGYWNGGVGYETPLDQAPEVVAALKYMESKGGTIIMHGYTHQYNDEPNPRFGVSGDDWEFYRVVATPDGEDYTYLAPVNEDSESWVTNRLALGRQILTRAGFALPTGWVTPHYMASATAYSVFAREFDYSLCQTTHFSTDSLGYIYYQPLFTPYPIKDEYGTLRIPETLSYISLEEANMSPQQIINRAKGMKVVRDGWAGMYFHPFLSPSLLRTAVRGVKAQGFTFVTPSKSYGPVPR